MKAMVQGKGAALLVMVFALALTAAGYAAQEADITEVSTGQKMEIDGVILDHQGDILTVRSLSGEAYRVEVQQDTRLKEKKSNIFRGAKTYSASDLVPGLRVEVKGTGGSSGAVTAWEIRFRDDDLIVAQAMDVRVDPVEEDLRQTQTRLGETEQNAERLSGQVQELSAISNSARGGARAAQETADSALTAAAGAQSAADRARAGVSAANERITLLDDYEVKETVTVNFRAGSAALTPENKADLDAFAHMTGSERGFVVEVAGFASADGDVELNRRLSRKRADAVTQYLVENHQIPLRRFVTPMGYGETQPVADNTTVAGRRENRRVEVRLLVSRGILAPGTATAASAE